MKKIYLLTGTLFAVTCMQAQQLVPYAKFGQNKQAGAKQIKQKVPGVLKNEGDNIYSSDFSDPTAWTWTDNSVPVLNTGALVIGTQAPQGPYSDGMGAITSTTAANGFALFDSDYGYTSTAGAQDIKLTWDTIMDFTTYPNVTLEFQSYHRKFHDSTYVEFKVDGGAWQQYAIEAHADLGVGDNSDNPVTYVYNVSSIVGGHGAVEIRFRYIGEWDYAWMIDDFRMVETFSNEMVLGLSYMSTPDGEDYYKIPASQAGYPGATFGAYAENQGAVNQNVQLSVTQNGGTAALGTAVAIPVAATDTISMETPVMLVAGTNTFVVTTDIGVTDQNPANNVAQFDVVMEGKELSRHDGVARKYFNYVAGDDGMRVGNLFHITDAMDLATVNAHINSAATNVGRLIFAEVELYDAGNDVYTSLGTAETEVTVDNNGDYVEFDFTGAAIHLDADSYIRVWAGNYTEVDAVRFSSAQKTMPQISFVGFYDAGSNTYDTYWVDDAPMISIVEGIAGVEENTADFSVNVFPNPAAEQTTVSFDLTNASDVVITVTDLSGKVVYTNAVGNTTAGKHNVEINTAQLAGGIYAVNFSANNTVVTKKLVVKK